MLTKKLIIAISALLLLPLCWAAVGNIMKQRDHLSENQVRASSLDAPIQGKDSVIFLSDFDSALRQAASETKPIMLFFALPDSSRSQAMLETTFENDEIKRLSRQFVCIQVNAIQDGRTCQRYQVDSFPTILILGPHGNELQRLPGRQTAEQLSLQMHVVIQSMAAQNTVTVRK